MAPSSFAKGPRRIAAAGRSLAFAVLVFAGSWQGCDGGAGTQGPKTRPPPQVIVQAPTVRDVAIEAKAPIDLRPLQVVDIGSKQLGYLSSVLVERGDRVRRGQLVALVRPSDLPDQLRSAQSALAQAQAALSQARSNRARLGELAPSGVVSMQEVEQSRTAQSQAEAQEATAQAQLAAIATRLGETRIDSPIDGVVMSRRLDPGALVGPSTAGIVTVARIDVLKAIMPVRERDAQNLQLGQTAQVMLDARPGESHPAQIVRIAPGFDPVTRTLDVELQLQNAAGTLRPGMYGRAALRTDLHPRAVVVPEGAVFSGQSSAQREAKGEEVHGDDSGRFVYVVDGQNRVRKRQVTVGYDGGNWLEVKKGLDGREQIIVAGAEVVADGMEVRPLRNRDVYSGAALPPAGAPSGVAAETNKEAKTPASPESKAPAGAAHVAH
ncbi:MAG: efflux RND transporter periplasmic adaptor subunit [Myxococcales bacterium]|nr:efflux RND transporter periplasmic adaptor subunit [Myxococcales bacterium]